MKVNELATVALATSPVWGTIRAAMAETPNATDPVRLMTAILHIRPSGFQHHSRWHTSPSARPLATRKLIEPNRSGAHTRASSCRVDRSRSALSVLRLKKSVPVSWTLVAH